MAAEPTAYALDSFALLAYLEGEVGEPRVKDLLQGAQTGNHSLYLSLINLGEVLYIIEREKGLIQAQRALAAIDQLPLKLVPISRATVLAAAHIKAHYPISYADAFTVATAEDCGGALLTGNPEFRCVSTAGLITVEWSGSSSKRC